MGNASSQNHQLGDYHLPTYAAAPVAERQDQDEFERRLETAFRGYLAHVQHRHAVLFPADADIDWAAEAPISALPAPLLDATIECFSGATLTELAALFCVPLNAQLLPDSRSLAVSRRNVTALHPDHRRARSNDLYGPAMAAHRQFGQLVMRQADLFADLAAHDSAYHLDDRPMPASLQIQPRAQLQQQQQQQQDEDNEGGEDAMDTSAATLPDPEVEFNMYLQQQLQQQGPVTPEEREAIRTVMRPVWGDEYQPTESELAEAKARMRVGGLSLPAPLTPATTGQFALAGQNEEERARALTEMDMAAIREMGAALPAGQGAFANALIPAPRIAQPRFFQGHRIADRQLVPAGDSGVISFSGGITGDSGSGQLVGTPLSVAYRPRAVPDLNDILPLRSEDNSDITHERYLERQELYRSGQLQLSTQRLLPTVIVGSAHNEARGDVAAAKGKGITSLRPGGGQRKGKQKQQQQQQQDNDDNEGGDAAAARGGAKRTARRDDDEDV